MPMLMLTTFCTHGREKSPCHQSSRDIYGEHSSLWVSHTLSVAFEPGRWTERKNVCCKYKTLGVPSCTVHYGGQSQLSIWNLPPNSAMSVRHWCGLYWQRLCEVAIALSLLLLIRVVTRIVGSKTTAELEQSRRRIMIQLEVETRTDYSR